MQRATNGEYHAPPQLPCSLPHRIARLILITSLGILSIYPASADEEPTKDTVPNIVLILADDLGYAELGSYGQEKIKTPNLDRLARQGMRFTQHYCGNAVCAPSRCVLMTGKHPGHAYIRNNRAAKLPDELTKRYGFEFPGQEPIPDAEVTIAEMLKQKGYATAAVGKWGL
ncbi:MAG: sulfatase-like hydrolase/transferase, partial [Planctomycetota bacterium]